MRLEWRVFSRVKSGNHPDENEDAWFPAGPAGGELKEFRCAVADGATSTSFAQVWAQLLVETSVSELATSHNSLKPVLRRGQTLWNEHLNSLDLPWHALEKIQQGAFSTLLWFKAAQSGYSNKTLGIWQALAVGDSCFCQVRGKSVQAFFPAFRAGELNNHPLLLSSVESRNEVLWKTGGLKNGQGAFEGGDEFFFMTDALAGWFLDEMDKDGSPAEALREAATAQDGNERLFVDLIRRLRKAGSIKNDDTTLGYLRIWREGGRGPEKAWN